MSAWRQIFAAFSARILVGGSEFTSEIMDNIDLESSECPIKWSCEFFTLIWRMACGHKSPTGNTANVALNLATCK